MNKAVEIAVRRHTWAVHPSYVDNESGQSIVELTLLLPLLFLIFLGASDLARLFYHASALTQAARSGVQYGAQNLGTAADISGMRDAARNAASDLGLADADFTPAPRRYFQCGSDAPTSTEAPCADGRAPKVFVEVSVQKTFSTVFNYPLIPHTVNVSRVATMRVR